MRMVSPGWAATTLVLVWPSSVTTMTCGRTAVVVVVGVGLVGVVVGAGATVVVAPWGAMVVVDFDAVVGDGATVLVGAMLVVAPTARLFDFPDLPHAETATIASAAVPMRNRGPLIVATVAKRVERRRDRSIAPDEAEMCGRGSRR
jgi:hypothetical protein